jgi:hypothetical protein
MDPRGALKLYEKAVNSPQREMLDGVGHGEKSSTDEHILPTG